MVQPAIGCSRLQHRVFPADLIGKGRHAESLFDVAQHVQIGHARFHHDHVGTFADVGCDFAQGFDAIGRIHLISGLVRPAEVGR